ncbi:MAG TPA: Gfo/Idh/MocA family oxidoreductase [Pirellulales bacterium]|jgi:predicted dehydrogenase|nr:Gfo/Idh/MocA family oxidoreductase [Pirellulales bacterium]
MNVAVVGIGFMGMIHYLAYQKVRGAKVAAIATRNTKRLAGDWRGIKGNFGPPGTMMDLKGVEKYEHWEDMLNDKRIDLVDVCLPPKLHPEVTIAALRAGKHVLVEKPIALGERDARRMTQTAAKCGKQLLIGHVLPFFPEYAFARKVIASGKYGKMLGGHFKRTIADPSWAKDFFDPDSVGGPMIDLHIHDAHFIRLVCGMPRAVFSSGRMRGEVVEFFETQFLFDDKDLAVTASGGVIRQQGRSFTHGFEIHLERATLVYDFAVVNDQPVTNIPLTVIGPHAKVTQPKLTAGDAFVAELTETTQSIKRNTASPLLSSELALDALVLCQRETQSVRTGKIVNV